MPPPLSSLPKARCRPHKSSNSLGATPALRSQSWQSPPIVSTRCGCGFGCRCPYRDCRDNRPVSRGIADDQLGLEENRAVCRRVGVVSVGSRHHPNNVSTLSWAAAVAPSAMRSSAPSTVRVENPRPVVSHQAGEALVAPHHDSAVPCCKRGFGLFPVDSKNLV